MTNKQLAKKIDHTNLKAFATSEDIEKLCHEAAENKFASVCINSVWVKKAAKLLRGTDVAVCTVVGFPLGACNRATKAYEAASAVQDGANEVDMVIDIGAVKDGRWNDVKADVAGVVSAVKRASERDGRNGIVKVILETCYLEKEEIVQACKICVKAGANFVKTSTGFGTGGATVEDVKLMRETVGKNIGVKAAGGIRDRETALAMIEAGANRIGCSAGIAIINGQLCLTEARYVGKVMSMLEDTKDLDFIEVEKDNFDTILAPDITFTGKIKFSKPFMIKGKVFGSIESTGDLVIVENAVVKADITARRVLVKGDLEGNVNAEKFVYVSAEGSVLGDLTAPQVILEPGSHFTGKCTMK